MLSQWEAVVDGCGRTGDGDPLWVRACFASCVGAQPRREITEALRDAGLEVAAARDPDPRIPSMVVFDAALAEALELIRAQGAHVHERVLAVALGDALAPGAALQLIAAGASDVLVRSA